MPDILVNIVGKVRRVPDNHVPVGDTLSIDEAVELGLRRQR
jgi:hypothetical protein